MGEIFKQLLRNPGPHFRKAVVNLWQFEKVIVCWDMFSKPNSTDFQK